MDAVDREIIEALLTRERTAHELARDLMKSSYKGSFVRYRLGRLAEDGLVRKRDGPRGPYYVPLEGMVYGRARLVVASGKGHIDIDLGRVLVTTKGQEQRLIVLGK